MDSNHAETAVFIPAGEISLAGDLALPAMARGVVVFAHGSGSSRHSPRNRAVAGVLQEAGLATLLMDLLTPEEEQAERFTRHLRFDIALLAQRLGAALDWLARQPSTQALGVGLFGASTGGGAALVAAAQHPRTVRAVVSRGGRPDLAGERDEVVIALNRQMYAELRCEKQLHLVPGATHLFEEPGALKTVAQWARDWFSGHLSPEAAPPDARGITASP